MGGQYNSFSSEAKNFKLLGMEFRNAQSEDEYENGHSYSGGWGQKEGLRDTGKVFNSRDEAEEWIQDNNEKWGPADAVKFRANGKETPTSEKAKKKLYDAVDKAVKNFRALEDKFANEIRTAKSAFRACRDCKSKVNKNYIQGGHCPVCRSKMYSPTQAKRLDVLMKKIEEAKLKRTNFKPKYSGGKKTKWLVGGWCSC
jgi:Zn finger protein HypA/HybF involved in hydrogenase expression